jgi:hypothetical protein
MLKLAREPPSMISTVYSQIIKANTTSSPSNQIKYDLFDLFDLFRTIAMIDHQVVPRRGVSRAATER